MRFKNYSSNLNYEKNIKRIFFLLMLISGTDFLKLTRTAKNEFTPEMHPETKKKNPGKCQRNAEWIWF
jgi:hypothetical protein